MANNRPLTSEERLEIVEVLKKGNLSHRAIAKRFNRSQSTISSIARDAGITPTHRRRSRTGVAGDVESTYNRQKRVDFEDRFLNAIDEMVSGGGLTPREAREAAQAAKVLLDARRAEDIEPDDTSSAPDESRSTSIGTINLEEVFRQLDEEAERECSGAEQQQGHPRVPEEYGSSSFTVRDK
jgi:transposase-like protein